MLYWVLSFCLKIGGFSGPFVIAIFSCLTSLFPLSVKFNRCCLFF
jgi:hypothetical protein